MPTRDGRAGREDQGSRTPRDAEAFERWRARQEEYMESDYEGAPVQDDEEPGLCGHCNGSGEGMHDGSRCTVCRGSGAS